MEKIMKYESILLVEPGDEVLVLKKEVVCNSNLTNDVITYEGEEYYLAKVIRKIKDSFFINDSYLVNGLYEVLTDEIVVSIENEFIGNSDVKVLFQNILKYNRTTYVYNNYILRIEEFKNIINNLTIEEDNKYERLIIETANCSLKEWVLSHNLLYNYFQLKEYDIGQNITINFSEECKATIPIKNIEFINHSLYLDLNLDNVENLNNIFKLIVVEDENGDRISDFLCNIDDCHFPILNDLIYNVKDKILKIKLDSSFIYENNKYKISFKDKTYSFKIFSDLLRFIQESIISNMKQKIEIGICEFKFDQLYFEKISDSELIMEMKYRNENNHYTLNDTIIEIDLQQDTLSINNIKSLLENDEILIKIKNQ